MYHVKNTAQFRKQLRDLQFKEDEIINSHDVVSLFTNVPINKVMAVIRKQLEGNKTLKKGPNLTPDDVMSLLEFVFQFDGEFYQQVHGTPIWARSPWW